MKISLFLGSRTKTLSALSAFGLLVSPGLAPAQTLYFWTGTGGGASWTTPANWNNATQAGATATTAPGQAANDSVTINQGSTVGSPVVLNNTATTTIGALTLGGLASSSGHLAISGTGTVLSATAAGFNVSNGVGATSSITINNGGELDFNPSASQVVFGSGSNSTVSVTVGGTNGSAGTLRNNGTSASTTRLANQVGSNSSMTVNAGGSVFLPGQFLVGSSTNSTASLTVNGGLVSAGNAIVFGQNGANATFTLTSGTVTSSGNSSFNATSVTSITGGLYTLTSAVGATISGTFTLDGGVVSVGSGFTTSGAGAVATMNSGSLVGTSGGTARLTVGGGSMSIGGGVVNLTGATSTIGGGALLTQSGGAVTLAGFNVGNAASGTFRMTGGSLTATSISVSSGAGSNGTWIATGGTATTAAGFAVANGSTALGGQASLAGPATLLMNSSNGASNTLTIGTNSGTGAAGTLLLQGGSIASAAGATNGYSVALYTSGSLTSATTTTTLQGYGSVTLGSTGTKTFTNGGKVIASGANLVTGTGSPADHTLDLTGSTFTVATTANRSAGAGWYAVNHGQLSMNVSGTASATTLNWGAPSGSFTVNSLVNSAQLTFATAAAPSAVTISLLASDRSDIAALWSQAGLPGGAGSSNAIGIWSINNSSGATWNGLTLRYDDSAVTPLQTLALYYIPDASGTWSVVSATIDNSVNFTVTHTGSTLNSGYYALIAVPEPNTMWLLAIGAGLVVGVRRLRARSARA